MAIVHGVALHIIAKPRNHAIKKYKTGSIPQDVLHNPKFPVDVLRLLLGIQEQLEKT